MVRRSRYSVLVSSGISANRLVSNWTLDCNSLVDLTGEQLCNVRILSAERQLKT